ncbi:MAG: hypothetical protein HC879_03025 [Leptolyngbyaceae cyanobacterium SL_5_9]|nr:hypothetical protein [Leptolyngbyaceae cyanobacterium SL_5_9]NJO73769.1 hypothetical protein [Leptolyngbyaceae cyanobacterium RM1_406_9]
MPRPTAEASDFTERKAIKGLRPFTAEDAEIFAQLQRNRSLKECLESFTSGSFRFGILMGESGSGKTSFLQAGALSRLSTLESTHRAVYVKFADRHPIDTIRAALTDQLKLPREQVATADLLTLLATAEEAIAKPLILLFDQFEQFFVHHKHRSDRQPFIQALTDWYRTETFSKDCGVHSGGYVRSPGRAASGDRLLAWAAGSVSARKVYADRSCQSAARDC